MGMRAIAIDGGDAKRDLCLKMGAEEFVDFTKEKAVDLALHKVLGKIERHQKQDGSFEGQGWAPVLAQSMAGKGINRARQAAHVCLCQQRGCTFGADRLAHGVEAVGPCLRENGGGANGIRAEDGRQGRVALFVVETGK